MGGEPDPSVDFLLTKISLKSRSTSTKFYKTSITINQSINSSKRRQIKQIVRKQGDNSNVYIMAIRKDKIS